MELAGGVAPRAGVDSAADRRTDDHLFGAITVMTRTLLGHGAGRDPDRSPQSDAHTTRPNWGTYTVVFPSVRNDLF